jgi:hypothetical protein
MSSSLIAWLLEKAEKWQREIEASCPYKFENEKLASIPPPAPLCKLTGKACDYNYCPRKRRESGNE